MGSAELTTEEVGDLRSGFDLSLRYHFNSFDAYAILGLYWWLFDYDAQGRGLIFGIDRGCPVHTDN